MLPSSDATFTALDFETANRYRNSACAIGLVRVEQGQVVERCDYLIRPPFRWFEFTYIHGIDWRSVERAPTFDQLWPEIAHFFEGVDFVAAHNASFDRSVLHACCRWYGMAEPAATFECTVRLARLRWDLRPTTLRHVTDFLGIELRHHQADSDAEACAQIVLSASAA